MPGTWSHILTHMQTRLAQHSHHHWLPEYSQSHADTQTLRGSHRPHSGLLRTPGSHRLPLPLGRQGKAGRCREEVILTGHWACPTENKLSFPGHFLGRLPLVSTLYRLAGARPNHLPWSLCFRSLGLARGLRFHILQAQTTGRWATHLLGSPPCSCCLRVCPALGRWESHCEVRGAFCSLAPAPSPARPFSILPKIFTGVRPMTLFAGF